MIRAELIDLWIPANPNQGVDITSSPAAPRMFNDTEADPAVVSYLADLITPEHVEICSRDDLGEVAGVDG